MESKVPEAKVAGTKSIKLELEPGTYFYCSCGESKKQPFCDGSHSGTGFAPMAIEITEKKKYAFCACKKTAKAPFCDGKHKALRKDSA